MATVPRTSLPLYHVLRHRGTAFSNAGNFTVGAFVWFMSPGVVEGLAFYTPIVGAHTMRLSLRAPATGAVLATLDYACAGPGTYYGMFAAPFSITAAHVQSQGAAPPNMFAIQMWETSGTSHVQDGTTGHYQDDKGLWYVQEQANNYRVAGDNWIGTLGTNVYCPIDVIGYALAEELPGSPARVQLPAGYIDLFTSNAPVGRLALINCIPEDGETGVKADANLKLTIASLDNAALDAATKVYFSIDGSIEVLVYDQSGGGFQAGWNGANSSATVQASPGSGVNDELVLVIDPTVDFSSLAVIRARVTATAGAGASALEEVYTFTIEDLTEPGIESLLWIDPRRVRVRFDEILRSDSEPGGSTFCKHISDGCYIYDSSTIQLAIETPKSTWVGMQLSFTGSVYPQNNRVRPILSVDTVLRRVTVDTSGGYGVMIADDGVDKDTAGNTVRERKLQLSVSPWLLTARLDQEGAGTLPGNAERVQCAYIPVPIAASLPEEDEIPAGDSIYQYVVLDFHDDISINRLYTLAVSGFSDLSGNAISTDSIDFTTPPFDFPANRATLWSMIPELTQIDDLRNDGQLRRMCVVIQDLLNVLWYRVDQMQYIPDPARIPRHLLDFMLHKLGNPFRFGTGTEQQKRRLAGRLKTMYRKLGVVGGIEGIIEFFLDGVFDVEPLVLAGTWVLNQSILSLDTTLGGGSSYLRNSYIVRSYRTLTDDERTIVREIATWADPCNMHLVAIVEPGGSIGYNFWVLNSSTNSILGSTTTLSL